MKTVLVLILAGGVLTSSACGVKTLSPEEQAQRAAERSAKIKADIDAKFQAKLAEKRDHADGMAAATCEELVERQLKAPATAKFAPARETVIANLGGGKYRVSGYVDSQNSFGALIRSRYSCAVTTTNGTNFVLDQLEVK